MDVATYCGDCLELMKELPDGSVDMVLCDLPYGTTRNDWDKRLDLSRLWTEYNRVVKLDGAICLFAQLPFTIELGASNIANLRYKWIWQKTKGSGFLNVNRMPLKAHEDILVFYRKAPAYHEQRRYGFANYHRNDNSLKTIGGGNGVLSSNYGPCGPSRVNDCTDGSRRAIDVLTFDNQSPKERGLHPTQKPVPLLEYLVKVYTKEGDTVLDNCAGSGSTGVACINTRRNFIGMELDQGYFSTMQQRLKQAQAALL